MLVGYVDSASSIVSGWAGNSENAAEIIPLDIYVGGNHCLTIPCVHERPDLKSTFGNTKHGFICDISPFLIDGENDVEITYSGTRDILPNGKFTLTNIPEGAKCFGGLDGWLFLDNDYNQVMDQLNGTVVPDHGAVIRKLRNLRLRQTYCLSYGTPHISLIAPERGVLYPEKIDKDFYVTEARYAVELSRYSAQFGVDSLLYPVQELFESKQSFDVCWPNDTHLSEESFFLLYTLMMEATRTFAPVPRHALKEVADEITGDLGVKVRPIAMAKVKRLCHPDQTPKVVFSNQRQSLKAMSTATGRVTCTENNKAEYETCVLFGTSSAHVMSKFLAMSFRKVIHVWSNDFDFDLVDIVRPDFACSVFTERMLSSGWEDVNFAAFNYETISAAMIRNMLKIAPASGAASKDEAMMRLVG